jgi:vacuolar-type H+-ATPase catalytic subunit A/Vma1
VRVGHDNLVGEVIRIEADRATIQVYEETGRLIAVAMEQNTDQSKLVLLSETLSFEPESLCLSNWDLD